MFQNVVSTKDEPKVISYSFWDSRNPRFKFGSVPMSIYGTLISVSRRHEVSRKADLAPLSNWIQQSTSRSGFGKRPAPDTIQETGISDHKYPIRWFLETINGI
jgi:hypothetical protein